MSNANTTAADGDVLKIDEAGIIMTVPKGFKFSKDGEDTIVQSDTKALTFVSPCRKTAITIKS